MKRLKDIPRKNLNQIKEDAAIIVLEESGESSVTIENFFKMHTENCCHDTSQFLKRDEISSLICAETINSIRNEAEASIDRHTASINHGEFITVKIATEIAKTIVHSEIMKVHKNMFTGEFETKCGKLVKVENGVITEMF